MEFVQKITSYFKQSLVDGERLSPQDKDLLPTLGIGKSTNTANTYIACPKYIWHQGIIPRDLANNIINAKQNPKASPRTELELVLIPRIDLFDYQRGWTTALRRRVLTPLCIFVRLQRDGAMLPGNVPPWIPREWLSPNISTNQPFAEFSNIDKFLTANPYSGIKSWPDLMRYCEAMLSAAVGYNNIRQDSSGSLLYEIPLHSEYRVLDQCLLQTEPPVIGAKAKILNTLESLLLSNYYPQLYQNFTRTRNATLNLHNSIVHEETIENKHIAQMTGEFALSHHQRNGLHYCIKQEDGEILAINGPPGTGKTTLLRSIVANLWVTAALQESEPPLIVATSSNNQAVTNILESFVKIDERGVDRSLQARWLPELNSYGLYCCSTDKKRNTPYLHMDASGKGTIRRFQNQAYVRAAEQHFLSKVSAWVGRYVESIETAKVILHTELITTVKEISRAVDIKSSYVKSKSSLHTIATSADDLELKISLKQSEIIEQDTYTKKLQEQYDSICRLWENRSIWIHLFFWVPAIKKMEHRKTERLLRKWFDHIRLSDFSDDEVVSWLQCKLNKGKQALSELKEVNIQYKKILTEYLNTKADAELLIDQYSVNKLFSEDIETQCAETIDRTLRFKSFKLATHYWEARWIEEANAFLLEPDEHERSPTTMPRRYRRHAKLTPCFVSTFYMLPAIFTAYRGEDKPLFETIDLLIVDEAGQALAEVAAASFALSKRAIIVGDTDQIEPVWNVPEKIDLANLAQFQLLDSDDAYESFWKRSGLLASTGSVMKVAQRQSKYHQYKELSRGLYLIEHRRCYDNIIKYCNDLVYKGTLQALRGNPKSRVPWGTMSFVEVYAPSQTIGGSRANDVEASSIVRWLISERLNILGYAREQNPSLKNFSDEEVLKKVVGVVTPFSRQAKVIEKHLNRHGITGLTVGTVHRLQGDERLLILFSTVYGENDLADGKFYDQSNNMLNVAVSRAKDSFIVFGHPAVFGVGSAESPSGMLRLKLKILNASPAGSNQISPEKLRVS